ncbi:MAG: Maf family protein [Firmicutes bacterium]|nr:Maf family protein [Bacillota bacterium]MCL5058683.1 Maf family protein [Actinomycetota bacterium]
MIPIYLASASPRRRELLQQLGLDFTVLASNVDESAGAGENPDPAWLVETLSLKKAGEVAGGIDRGLVIGSDTVVVWRNRIMGKPRDREDALEMLYCLQGDEHMVYSGLAVIDCVTGAAYVSHERTRVFFRPAGKDELEKYTATGEPLGKAGAYAIQGLGSVFVKGIEGCYSNVVGLPLAKLARALKKFGVDVLDRPLAGLPQTAAKGE